MAAGKDGREGPETLFSEVMRPKVPMGLYVGAPYAAALGICEALDGGSSRARIAWPHDVAAASEGGSCLVRVSGHGGYDDDGLFCRIDAAADGGMAPDAGLALDGARRRMASWEAAIAQGQGMAGPLAAFLPDYFDHVGLMDHDVEIRFPNGRLMGRGRLCGVDIWGRASVRAADGREIVISPEQARIVPARPEDGGAPASRR